MLDRVQQKIETAQIAAGYTVSGALASTPIWMDSLEAWLQIFAVAFAVLVGATTFFINVMTILEKRKRSKK